MNFFWEIIASNALVATFLAIGTMLLSRAWKNPAAIHLLWVVVLLKLFTPPIVTVPFAANWLPSTVSANSAGRIPSSPAGDPAEQTALGALPNPRDTAVPNTSQHKLTMATENQAYSLATILAAIWICGTSCIALGYFFRIRRFARLLRNVKPPSQAIATMITQLASRLGLSRMPSVLMTSRALPPLVWSIGGRPRLILPSALFGRLSQNAQAAILAHELAHISRRDYLVRVLELAATTLFWWHPVVWWACSQLRELEDQCCDSRAIELLPHQARTFAAALVDTLDFLSEQPRIHVPLPTAVHSTGSLSRRIRMLDQNRINRLSVLSAGLVAGLVAIPLVVAFGAEGPANGSTVILSGHVTNETGAPLADVRILVAFPATDMRFIDSSADEKRWETKTDANGKYQLELPEITKASKIAIDALKPGYRRLSGTLMSGGDEKDIEVAPGRVAEASLMLKPALYVKGIILDEQGKPIPDVEVSANADTAHASGGVERTKNKSDGTFEIFNYSPTAVALDDGAAKGVVNFFHPNYVSAEIQDVYALSTDDLIAQRIVLPTGYKISGEVLDDTGKPVPNLMIKTTCEDWRNRKATMTDASGKFVLRGLSAGPATLSAHALELKQKINLPITLAADKNDLEVRLQAIPMANPKTFAVLGMQLADVTPQLKSAYDLYHDHGALILDPGKDSQRLGIGQLAEGYNFFIVGDKRINSVREFVTQILAEAAAQSKDEPSIRVVYSFSTLDFDGTNTQHMKLTKDDLAQLRKVLDELPGD